MVQIMVYFFYFNVFVGKYILDWIGNLGLKSRKLYRLMFRFLLGVHANLPEISPFLSAQMTAMSIFYSTWDV